MQLLGADSLNAVADFIATLLGLDGESDADNSIDLTKSVA